MKISTQYKLGYAIQAGVLLTGIYVAMRQEKQQNNSADKLLPMLGTVGLVGELLVVSAHARLVKYGVEKITS